MSRNVLGYLLGMALVFAGQRLYAGNDNAHLFSILGLLVVGASIVLRLRSSASETGGRKEAQQNAVRGATIGLVSILIYALTTDKAVGMLPLGEDSGDTWRVALGALWPIFWLLGTAMLVTTDAALQNAPRMLPSLRAKHTRETALIATLGLALVFPVNYLADQHNERWDLSYFKTAEAGTATVNLVKNLTTPVTVRVFQSPSSEVAEELLAYLRPLEGPTLTIELLDQASDPALSRELKIRDNGYVAITGTATEEGETPVTKSFKIGTDIDSAKSKLRTLDEDFHKTLVQVSKGSRIAYLTTGHGELSTKSGDTDEEKLSGLKQILGVMGFKVKELGLEEGLGDAIPEDADAVLILGPVTPFLVSEVDTLQRYLDRNGALFLALEGKPSSDLLQLQREDPLDDLLAHVGLAREDGVLASETSYAVEGAAPTTEDRENIVTNRFSSHPSTTTLSKHARRGANLILPGATALSELDDFSGKVTVIVRSLPHNWSDIDGDLNFSASAGEEKKARPIAAASEGNSDSGWRSLVVGDATAFSDRWLAVPGNQVFFYDSLNWLIGEESASGTLQNEEDVKIEHTREDQVAWFYGSILGMPLLVLGGGIARIRRRRRRNGEIS